MSQKLPVNDFIKYYKENSDVGYFLDVDVEYPINLSSAHKELSFLRERKKFRKNRKTCL